jgi:uncharacterized membrane protein
VEVVADLVAVARRVAGEEHMNFARILRHLFTTMWSARRAFPKTALDAIEQAIRESEQKHRGQIRFVVEHSLDLPDLLHGVTAKDRAVEMFARLHVWDTEHNNGVLIYLLLADRDVEILADRGVHAHVGSQGWETICRAMEDAFRAGDFHGGVLRGIRAAGEHLDRHYPTDGPAKNELPDRPVIL